MTRYFLGKMVIEGFRGINNGGAPLVLSFKPECVNSIHAQNGVGKSSIFEALQFAIKGEIPRLTKLQGAEQGASYIVNRFHPGQQATIELTFESDDGSAPVSVLVTRTGAGVRSVSSPSGHASPEDFLRSLDEDFVLVDYHTFAGFIDTSALERGRSFAGLIGLSRYSRLRQALEGANHTQSTNTDFGAPALNTKIQGERTRVNDAKAKVLAAYKELTGIDAHNVDDRAEMEAKVTDVLAGIGPLKDIMVGKTVVDFDYDAAVAAIEAEEDGESRKTLAKMRADYEAIHALTAEADHSAQLTAITDAANARDEALQKIGSGQVLSLLKSAANIIGTESWPDDSSCPVCELPQPEPLKGRLEEKIELYAAVAELDKELCKLCLDSPAVGLMKKLEATPALNIAAEHHLFPPLAQDTANGSIPTARINSCVQRVGELIALRDAKVAELEADIQAMESKLPPSLVASSRAVQNARSFRDDFGIHAAALANLHASERKLATHNRWRSFIDKAAKAFAQAETELSTARLQEIEGAYQALFPALMRGAPNLKPELSRAANSENVDLRLSDFYGEQNVNARAVLSESYRNAVAASIFLSAATKQTRPPRFMVLDDITSSFDGGHQFYLMDALLMQLRHGVNPEGIQFIVLSHDAALEKYFDKLGSTPHWHHQKLQGNPPQGFVLTSAQGADRLKAEATNYLNAGNTLAGAPLVRQYMEFKLGYIIAKLQIPVPPDYATRPDQRTLSTYLNAITSAVALYQQAGTCVLTAAQTAAIANTAVASMMTNMVSHYETSAGQPLNAHAMLGVIIEIDNYADNFQHADPQNPNQQIYYKRLDKVS